MGRSLLNIRPQLYGVDSAPAATAGSSIATMILPGDWIGDPPRMYKREADKKIERVAEEAGKSMAENSWPDAKVGKEDASKIMLGLTVRDRQATAFTVVEHERRTDARRVDTEKKLK